ncbi:uncharacterized protein LOC132265981 [Phlebotomus argentipes]|uniref:uncharacterized protein LOC132265981 n=1 Tax=Phlebotomus argentipes TaxID=94469 RepID=UPI00289353F7|nr:uncharacterized protein LOC132265981 [Phlebotomus argentipes]
MIYQSGGNRELSLVEQKKRQWQKEREEMAKLGDFPIKIESLSSTKYEKTSIRTFYASNMDVGDKYRGSYRKIPSHHGSFYDEDNRRLRSPSLPPIGRQKFSHQGSVVRQSTTEDDTGYTSGSPQHSDSSGGADVWTNTEPQAAKHRPEEAAEDSFSETTTNKSNPQRESQGHKMSPDSLDLEHETEFSKSLSTPSSSSSGGQSFASFQPPDFAGYHKVKEERAKWGDRGVTVGHLYDPIARVEMEKSARSVPVWLEKGLHEMRDSEDESVRSFIRGQNTPIDPQVLEERANRRRKAMELQDAIKEQLKERERQKKWEKERRLREERLEEERLMHQMEMERARFEYEQRLQQEKLEKERKKHDMMRRALVKAEMDAKIEKDRRKHKVFHKEASPPPAREREEAPKETEKCEEVKQEDKLEVPEEKMLIGTPIKLKKQVVSQEEEKEAEDAPPEKPVVVIDKSRPTDIDGIALVLQTMTPVVPLPIASDFLNATVNNLQLALLLAAQQRPGGVVQEAQVAAEPEKISMRESHNRECSYCCKIHGIASSPSPPKEEVIQTEEPVEEVPPKLPNEATFIKEDLPCNEMKVDVATSTTLDSSEADKTLTPRKYRRDSSSSVDVGVQTEITSRMCNLCCHHKLYLQEISTVTTSVTSTSKNKVLGERKIVPEEEKNVENETITTTTTTKTMIRSKPGKGKKAEPRPKWGVNRPLMQYIKASERDPFCLRQRRKKYQQRSFVKEEEEEEDDSSKSSSKHRNVCTEILPIKTDSNGRIFLNFHEASVMMKEDPVVQGAVQARQRIMGKRGEEQERIFSKDNKNFSNLAIVKASSARRQSSCEDVDTEECTSEISRD